MLQVFLPVKHQLLLFQPVIQMEASSLHTDIKNVLLLLLCFQIIKMATQVLVVCSVMQLLHCLWLIVLCSSEDVTDT